MGYKTKSRVYTIIITFSFIHLEFGTGIRIRNVSIPHYGVKDGTATLLCDFDPELDKVLDLKWYKDEKEFFRFTPNTNGKMYRDGQEYFRFTPNNHILVYPVEGVNVDIQRSNETVVRLKNISLSTSGLYRCEVLAEISFQRVSQQGQLIIIAPPLYDPEIRLVGEMGNQSGASIGERILGNCTSYRSKPPASLMFYINGQKSDFENIIEYSPINETGGLSTSTLGFNFIIQPQHLSTTMGKIELKCTASIGNLYRIGVRSLVEGRVSAQPSAERNQVKAGTSKAITTVKFSSQTLSPLWRAFISVIILLSPLS